MTTFFIGDTHFGHQKILEFESKSRGFTTIEEHDEYLIRQWNSVASKRDIIFHLGDVIFSGSQTFKSTLGRLNGIKKLVAGNHDSKRIHQLAPYFTNIVGVGKFEGYSLTHIPIHPSQFYRFKGNIHGHLHSDIITKKSLGGLYTIPDKRYWNVSAEQINLTPISWEQLQVKYKE